MLKSSGHGVHTRDGFTYCFLFFFVLLAVADDDGESPLVFFPLSLEEEAAAAFPSVASLEIILLLPLPLLPAAASQALHPLKETIALPPDDFTILKNRKPDLRF